jgi:pimeloyl-ACP methyl ester carboxylesterase
MRPPLNLVKGAPGGKPVVFQHGLCGSAAQTREAFPEDSRFQLHTLECRGHGKSAAGSLDAFSIATFAADVAEVLAAQAVFPCVVGGISMGAAMSLHLAVHRPELVKALVLARPAWVVEAAPEHCAPNREVGDLLHRHTPEAALTAFSASATARMLEQQAPDNLATLKGFFARQPHDVTSALLRRIGSDGPGVTEAQVQAITVPTLIVATEQDYIHPLAYAQALHRLMPHSQLAVITPKAVDKTRYVADFRQTLLTFLEEHA